MAAPADQILEPHDLWRVTLEPSNMPLCDTHHSGEAGVFLD